MVVKQFKALSMRETESHRKEITKGIVKKAIKMMTNKEHQIGGAGKQMG